MTFSQQKTYIRERLGISSTDTSKDTEIGLYLNAAILEVVADHALKTSKADLAFTAADPLVTLPADWVRTLSIQRGTVTLQPITWEEYAEFTAGERSADGPLYYDQASGTKLRVLPTPGDTDATGAVIWYVQSPTADDPVDIPAQFHSLPCERVVALMAAAEEALDLVRDAEARAIDLEDRLARFLQKRVGEGSQIIPLRVYRR